MFQILRIGNQKIFLTFVTRHECFSDTSLASATKNLSQSSQTLIPRSCFALLRTTVPQDDSGNPLPSSDPCAGQVSFTSPGGDSFFLCTEHQRLRMETKLVRTSRIKSLFDLYACLKKIQPYTSFSFSVAVITYYSNLSTYIFFLAAPRANRYTTDVNPEICQCWAT